MAATPPSNSSHADFEWLTAQIVEPGTLGEFASHGSDGWVAQSGNRYQVHDGIPVLLSEPELAALDRSNMAHFDSTPFDVADSEALESFVRPQFKAFFEQFSAGTHVADIGCGVGRNTTHLARRGLVPLIVDQSFHSLQAARDNAGGRALAIQASNIQLPLRSSAFDVVVSDGVIHITSDPERCFRELIRVVRPGGTVFLTVYKRGAHYDFLYNRLGGLFRGAKNTGASWLVDQVAVRGFQAAYWLRERLQSSHWPSPSSYEKAKNRFYDYFMLPSVRFYTPDDIRALASSNGGELYQVEPEYGTTCMYLIRKL